MSVTHGPTLADGLRAALLARVPSIPASAVQRGTFVAATHACDAADRAYRAVVSANLPGAGAREILAATNAFRARVRTVRANAVAEAARILSDSASEGYDPLDVVTPRIANLSHVSSVRLADVSDRARAEVAALRMVANDRIGPLLTVSTREALTEAKRVRAVAFRGAVHAALVPFTASIVRYSDIVEALASLADGWY